MQLIDLTGKKFGRLTVIERSGADANGQAMWRCKCECGNESSVKGGHLRRGHTRSCGCLENEARIASHTTHGKRHTRLYRIWSSMKDRCSNPNSRAYKWYGAKGVSVCREWIDFETFRAWAEANGYADNLTIDRIDSNGNYCPDNCRWITNTDQQSNRSNNRHLTYGGETRTIKGWAEKFGIEYFQFYRMLKKFDFDIGRMIDHEAS